MTSQPAQPPPRGPGPTHGRRAAHSAPSGQLLNHPRSTHPTAITHSSPHSSTAPATMMGPSVPWNPDPTGFSLYPSEKTLAAEYQAFLESYPSTVPAPPDPRGTHVYRHSGNDAQRQESRNSTSPSQYSTASSHPQYTSSDPYPPLNMTNQTQGVINTVDQHHQRQGSPDKQPMQSFSPDSYATAESPNVFSSIQYPYQSTHLGSYPSYTEPSWMSSNPLQNPQINEYMHEHPVPVSYPRSSDLPHMQQMSSSGVEPSQVQMSSDSDRYRAGEIAERQLQMQPPMMNRAMHPMPNTRHQPAVNSTIRRSQPPSSTRMNNRIQGPTTTTARPNARPQRPSVSSNNKRRRTEVEDDEDYTSDEDSQNEATLQIPQPQADSSRPARLPGACGPCKRLKMKCVFPEGDKICQRCTNSGRGHLCIVGPRKPRQPSNKKELLLQKLRDMEAVVRSKDAVIKTLLDQLQNPHIQISLKDAQQISSSISSSTGAQRPEERPIDKTILDWLQTAQASIQSTAGYRLSDGRPLEEPDSSPSEASFGRTLGSQMSPAKSSISDSALSAGRSGGLLAPDSHHAKSSPKLHSLPLESAPIGLLADMSLRDAKETGEKRDRSRSRSKSRSLSAADEAEGRTHESKSAGEPEDDDGEVGIMGKHYFHPVESLGLRNIQTERKDILEFITSGLISPAEVDQLFKIFFEKLNVFVSILDPVLHTPATTFGRSPFLFTVVCAISSRYYTERPELYSIAMHFARRAAASSLIEGTKSIELCQAYILMSVYSAPSRRWEDAREWLYLGLAIRMAIDLNLHVRSTTKPLNEQHERELLNRTRTWLICYNLDRSASAQLGKPASIRPDPIIRNCKAIGKQPAWWKSSPYNDPYDLHLCAYTDLLSSITAEFQNRVYWDPKTEMTGLRTDLDLVSIAFEFDDKLQDWSSKTAVSFATYSDSSSSQCAYRVQLLPFYVNYLRLVMLSLGFQQTVKKGNMDGARHGIVKRCLNAACAVLKTVVNDLAPTGYLRYAPDGHFVFSSFASAFLIKMLRPEHEALLDAEERSQIVELVERLINTLKSPQIAVDERHTPMLYSRFLASLLAKHRQDPNAEKAESITTESTNPDAGSLSTPPPIKQEGTSSSMKNPNLVSRHRPSPSIEISPPPPDHGSVASGMPSETQTIFDPSTVNHLSFPSMEDANTPSYDTSTIHASSTIFGGSQHTHDIEMTNQDMLAPMFAVDNPGFWSSMMLPGLSWPSVDDSWGLMNLDMDEVAQAALSPAQGAQSQQNSAFQS